MPAGGSAPGARRRRRRGEDLPPARSHRRTARGGRTLPRPQQRQEGGAAFRGNGVHRGAAPGWPAPGWSAAISARPNASSSSSTGRCRRRNTSAWRGPSWSAATWPPPRTSPPRATKRGWTSWPSVTWSGTTWATPCGCSGAPLGDRDGLARCARDYLAAGDFDRADKLFAELGDEAGRRETADRRRRRHRRTPAVHGRRAARIPTTPTSSPDPALRRRSRPPGAGSGWTPWSLRHHPVIQTVEVKSVLSRSGISGIDYSLNPYLGCLFGCRYCYADFVARYRGRRAVGRLRGHQEQRARGAAASGAAPPAASR